MVEATENKMNIQDLEAIAESIGKAIVKQQRTTPKVHTVPETARILRTDATNIRSLIHLGIFKPLLLGTQMIPDVQIDEFINQYAGKNLKRVVADEQLAQKEKRGAI
ncbi:hypothetical protein [Lentilactobacillus buchneri]|uniref:hypothetical protein n=1 Tax=Lentilactobacillus buchneri TaxID=1581 RepID=UPI0021A44F50|nr:hypothetical protein [Lentilactobacillus buchneri]MCT2882636.1 hypothetical protein [Lentilactobacillus buchneri]